MANPNRTNPEPSQEQPPAERSEAGQAGAPPVTEAPSQDAEQALEQLVGDVEATLAVGVSALELRRAFVESLSPTEHDLLDTFATRAPLPAPTWFKPSIEPCPKGSNEAGSRDWQERKSQQRDLQWPFAWACFQLEQRRALLP
jgi:hypothetical protein